MGPRRASHAVVVYDPDKRGGWVTVRQNAVSYDFDATRVMFSSGNTSEKKRMGDLGRKGEVVVDLYAGIGYFTVPLLVNAQVEHVHACEWNEPSLEALQRNLRRNGVDDRCTIYPGDNQLARDAVRGRADRVLLGLLPSSELAWGLALAALKPGGGWLHVHANVHEREMAEWRQRLLTRLGELAKEEVRRDDWDFECPHVEKVKKYAPRVDHVVADVRVFVRGGGGAE